MTPSMVIQGIFLPRLKCIMHLFLSVSPLLLIHTRTRC